MEQDLDCIKHQLDGQVIRQRTRDGYINATAMCKAAGKLWGNYNQTQTTREFLEALATDIGISISELVQSVKGGSGDQGTWVHPQVAIHLAQWLSPNFAVQVSKWVYDWISSGRYSAPSAMPYHLRRYVNNRGNVPEGHFSILTEMTQAIIAPMEAAGYSLPERMLPDISQGRMFCQWLRDEMGVDTDALPTYLHYYEDGRIVQAKAYPEELLPHFRKHLREVWIAQKAVTYFRQRDPNSIEFIAAIYSKSLMHE